MGVRIWFKEKFSIVIHFILKVTSSSTTTSFWDLPCSNHWTPYQVSYSLLHCKTHNKEAMALQSSTNIQCPRESLLLISFENHLHEKIPQWLNFVVNEISNISIMVAYMVFLEMNNLKGYVKQKILYDDLWVYITYIFSSFLEVLQSLSFESHFLKEIVSKYVLSFMLYCVSR